MSDEDSQIVTPPSFIALFVPPGRIKPTETRAHIAERFELCEDMANMLTEPAQTRLWELGITEADVLERMHMGLLALPAELSTAEAGWVTHRLAELLNWDCPTLPGELPGESPGESPGGSPAAS
jgi:hypothetical protein